MESFAPAACSSNSTAVFLLFYTNITSRLLLEDKVLEVSFNTSNLCNANFSVELWKTDKGSQNCGGMNGLQTHRKIIQARIPITATNFSAPFLNGFHCIRVTPLKLLHGGICRRGCNTVSKQFLINDTGDSLDCNEWNASVTLRPNVLHSNLSLTVSVSVIVPYNTCFSFLNVCLWFNAIDECNSLTGRQVDQQVLKGSHGEVFFKNLVPGNYCVRIHSTHPSCGDNGCSPLYSNILELFSRVPDLAEPQRVPVVDYGPPWFYAILVVGVIFAFSVVYFCYKKKLTPHLVQHFQKKNLKLHELEEQVKEATRRREVVLLYSPDFPEHSQLMLCLYHFLCEVCSFGRVYIDVKEEHNISIDLCGWTQRMMQADPNRRWLIAESEGAALYEEGRKRVKVVRRIDEAWDCLDPVFPLALQVLKERSAFDYGHILVLRFPYTSNEHKLQHFVPQRRFHLPNCMFELYWTLLDLRDREVSLDVLEQFKRKTLEHWRSHPQAIAMMEAISLAENEMRKNPNLVKDVFTEEPFFSTV